MQMGEMVRNLPEQAAMSFKWDEYARALITSLGFDARNWVRSAEDIQREQMQQQQMMMQQQAMQSGGQAISGALGNLAINAGQQDLAQTGGQGILNVLQNSGADVSAFTGGQ
jgi:hypothetical protein